MVSIILRGGLGNQLFQYATGRAHALRTNTDLFVDLSRLYRDRSPDVSKRSLHLDSFDLSEKYIEKSTTYGLGGRILGQVPRILATVSPQLSIRLFGIYYENNPQEFDQRVLELPSNITLNGYWQSECYFEDFADTLRDEIAVSNSPRGDNKKWYDQIRNSNSVSVHIRRGDYVSLGFALPPAYYREAIAQICRETGAKTLFFFSNDMDWVRNHSQELLPKNVDFNVNYIESNNSETAHEDLRLMRSCDAHVIANSTFSWWGAWLDEADSKHVVAPNYWFDTSIDRLDIVPTRWTTVDW